MKIQSIIFVLLIFFVFYPNLIKAQSGLEEGQTLDRIVAIVGEEIIMQSDIEGKLAILKQQNPDMNTDSPAIRKQVLDAAINEYLVVSKAIEDSVIVTEDEINSEWERFKADLVQYFGSYKRIEDVYGMSLSRIQYEYRDVARKQLLSQKLQQTKFGNIKVSPKEVEDFYKEYKDSLPNVPMQVELFHIVKYTTASQTAKEEVYELAKRVRDSIVNGGLFSDFAQKYSNDPGSASSGGELGWFGKGKLLMEFEKAAFELVPGQTSMPVETPFGFHIIQTLSKNKDSVLTRHILFRIGQSEDDKKSVIECLKSFKDSLTKGMDFESLAKKYSEETSTKGFGGALGTMPVDQIPLSFKEQVLATKVADISEPMPYNIDPSKPAYHIIYKKREIPGHPPNLKDDFKILEQKALVYKKMKIYEDWIKQLRSELYWEIKDN
ncbi:MAG: peptidylprolyl isomerase [bacterium]